MFTGQWERQISRWEVGRRAVYKASFRVTPKFENFCSVRKDIRDTEDQHAQL